MKISKGACAGALGGVVLGFACVAEDGPVRRSGDLAQAGGSSGASGAAPAGAAGAAGKDPAPPAGCPEGRGPSMVEVIVPGMPAFCIDSTEVTQAQYAAFLEQAPVADGTQDREICRKYNKSFVPPVAGHQAPGCPAGVYDPEKKPDSAMSCVDVCDALAFCQWSGKRLCGAVGGGPLEATSGSVAKQGQMYLACSQGGKTRFPYGDEFSDGLCNVPAEQEFTQPPVGESKCVGSGSPFDRIRDLSGGVAEWEDAQRSEFTFSLRGNNSISPELEYFACDMPQEAAAIGGSSILPTVGFRCCADAGQ